ncbi:Protein takeout [Frankliniella fusca]|uniref:Protein takeout n=1 Tax=Frankliniella fusca TaxID=407009 RepID=A0AAE1GRP1_9NEOP|nr:Protein takeout [Frankliniella fusca]
MKYLLVLLALCGLALAKPGKLPSSWAVCKKSDPALQKCFKEAVAQAIQSLAEQGEPSLGIFTVDPLRMTKLSIGQGTGPVAIDLEFRDLDMMGIKGATFTDATIDPKTYDMSASLHIPKDISLDGMYTIKGRVLVLPINGDGHCHLGLADPELKIDIKGVPVKRGAETYFNVTNFAFTLDTKKLTLHFENLFNGNKELGNSMNTFLNENSAEVLKELKPAISEGFGEVFRQIANRVFSKVPLDKIFPDK